MLQAVDADNAVGADIVRLEQGDLEIVQRTPAKAHLRNDGGIDRFGAADADDPRLAGQRDGKPGGQVG